MPAQVTRVSTPGQLEALARLIGDYVSSLPFELDFQDVAGELSELQAIYGPPAGAAFLAEEGDEALGCVALRRIDDETAELKRMFVAAKARGLGLGTALCAAVVQEAGRIGYQRIRLDTAASMTAAGRLYAAAGFVEIGPYRPNPLPDARYYELEIPLFSKTR